MYFTWFSLSHVCWHVLLPGAEIIQYSVVFMAIFYMWQTPSVLGSKLQDIRSRCFKWFLKLFFKVLFLSLVSAEFLCYCSRDACKSEIFSMYSLCSLLLTLYYLKCYERRSKKRIITCFKNIKMRFRDIPKIFSITNL